VRGVQRVTFTTRRTDSIGSRRQSRLLCPIPSASLFIPCSATAASGGRAPSVDRGEFLPARAHPDLPSRVHRSGVGERIFVVLPAVFLKVFRTALQFEVGENIVKSVPVLVVYHETRRNRPVGGLPHNDRPEAPYVRVGNLHPSAGAFWAVFALTNTNVSDSRLPVRLPAFLECPAVFHVDTNKRRILALPRTEPLARGQHVAGFAVERLGAVRTVFSRHEGSISRKRSMSIVGAGTSKPHLDAVPWVEVADRVMVARLRQQRLF